MVAAAPTDKTRWAHQCGKLVVSPQWLQASSLAWHRADEACFPVLPEQGGSDPAAAAGWSERQDVAAAQSAAGGGGQACTLSGEIL